MPPYRLVIFDFDGTLADSLPWFLGALGRAAELYGFTAPPADEIDAWRVLDAKTIIRKLGVPMWQVPRIILRMRAVMTEELDQVPLFDGIGPMLEGLAASGVTLALLTSNSEENARRVLGPELSALFTHVSCGASIFGKAAKLRKLLKASGHAPSEAIAVGDELRDVDAAREVAMPFGAVSWGYTLPDALAARSPEALFKTPADLLAQLAPSA